MYFNLWLTMFLVGMWHYTQGTSWNFVIYANLHARGDGVQPVESRSAIAARRSCPSSCAWGPGLAVLGGVIAGLSHVALDLPGEQAGGLGVFAVVAFLVVAWLPLTGTWWNTALHMLLTFHFTVLSRVFFRAESFESAKTHARGHAGVRRLRHAVRASSRPGWAPRSCSASRIT